MARKPKAFDDAAIAALPLPRKGRRTVPVAIRAASISN